MTVKKFNVAWEADDGNNGVIRCKLNMFHAWLYAWYLNRVYKKEFARQKSNHWVKNWIIPAA